LRYPGGKGKLWSQLSGPLQHIIDHEKPTTYWEPFFGGGSVGLSLMSSGAQFADWYFNDKDDALIKLWTAVRDEPARLSRSRPGHSGGGGQSLVRLRRRDDDGAPQVNIDDMPAGPEMDALVAEKVFCVKRAEHPEHLWYLHKDGTRDDCAMDNDFHSGPCCQRCGYSFCLSCKNEGRERGGLPCIDDALPSYSTTFAAAGKVLEKFKWFTLTSFPSGCPEVTRYDCGLAVPNVYGHGETMPLAICRAALKVAGL
jgi:hypothetical protein